MINISQKSAFPTVTAFSGFHVTVVLTFLTIVVAITELYLQFCTFQNYFNFFFPLTKMCEESKSSLGLDYSSEKHFGLYFSVKIQSCG